MKITIETIPHKDQRYPTAGDWYYDNASNLSVKVSEMENEDYEILVVLHELIEAVLCKDRFVLQDDVDKFDTDYEANRALDNMEEPGDDPRAPYHKEHVFAGIIERLMAQEMGIEWSEYEQELAKLG